MKKALALVLALVLALSMAVSAFAEVITLTPTEAAPGALKTVTVYELEDLQFTVYAGGVYHIAVEAPAGYSYKDLAVTSTGCVTASVENYDPEKYVIKDEDGVAVLTYKVVAYEGGVEKAVVAEELSYKDAVDAKKEFDINNKTTVYKVVCEQDLYIVKLVVEDNFTASYKTGSFKLTANRVELATKKVVAVAGTYKVVNDVVAFNYEEVKNAALYNKDGIALVAGTQGYSIYGTQGTYGTDKQTNATAANALVVPTTAFRAIEGKNLTVAADAGNYVTLKAVAAGQKGVNFAFSGFEKFNKDGLSIDLYGKDVLAALGYDPTVAYVDFGFLGDQVVKGDFEIVVTPNMNWFELREMFEIELEEDDIVTYYILKDGKVIDSVTVDYMTADYNEAIELVIKGSNSTLGWYTIALEVPAAEVETETEANPNTGAESVVGVVAALAVVSLASAAAISLKK